MNFKLLTKLKVASIAGVLAVAGTAYAATTFTGFLTIQQMDFTTEGLRLYPQGGISAPNNPGSCINDFYEPNPSLTEAQRHNLERPLLSALLGGRKVKVGVNSPGCGANGRAMYSQIRIDNNN
jgi:hypothetical protein